MQSSIFERPKPAKTTFQKTINALKRLLKPTDESPEVASLIGYVEEYHSIMNISEQNQQDDVDSYCKSHVEYVIKAKELTDMVLDLLDANKAILESKMKPNSLRVIRTQLIAWLNQLVITEYQIVLKQLKFDSKSDLVYESDATDTDCIINAFKAAYPRVRKYCESIESTLGPNVIAFINYSDERLYDSGILVPILKCKGP